MHTELIIKEAEKRFPIMSKKDWSSSSPSYLNYADYVNFQKSAQTIFLQGALAYLRIINQGKEPNVFFTESLTARLKLNQHLQDELDKWVDKHIGIPKDKN